ncbi:MAG: hypothetical protein DRP42_05210 [Tenericutes bacterium]|nr:MAG: hypothetical protein DRP42_05210 [Mycoplasmatota bacterium]
MAQAIRSWIAYNKAIWVKRGFVFLTKTDRTQDLRSCPKCGTPSRVFVNKLQAVLLCAKCEAVVVKSRKKKAAAPAHEQQPLPLDEAPVESDLPECLCCDRIVETKRHKYCAQHKTWSPARKAEQAALKAEGRLGDVD